MPRHRQDQVRWICQHRRCDRDEESRVAQTWDCEMLCKRPSVEGSVFPTFDPAIHVRESIENSAAGSSEISLALDFGFAAPFVCLWIRSFSDGVTHVIDEYVQPGISLAQHIEQIRGRGHGEVNRVACDPARRGPKRSDGRQQCHAASPAWFHRALSQKPDRRGPGNRPRRPHPGQWRGEAFYPSPLQAADEIDAGLPLPSRRRRTAGEGWRARSHD